MIRTWSEEVAKVMPYHLDSNEVAWQIQSALDLPDTHVHLVREDIATENPPDWQPLKTKVEESTVGHRLDACLLGVGVLNSGHSFVKSMGFKSGEYQARAMQKELAFLKEAQTPRNGRPPLLGKRCLGDLAHRFFPLTDIPPEVETVIEDLNNKIVTPLDILGEARQIFLCAGSSQKYPAIYKLFHDPDAKVPIDVSKTILITDQHCATQLLDGVEPDFS